MRERATTSRATETEQQLGTRLHDLGERVIASRASETVKEREGRLQDMRERSRMTRAAGHYNSRLEGFHYDRRANYSQHTSVSIGKWTM
ncbi:hypothetical protein AVEN_274916-1 [Araneus ventricosus]|uniref:STPR domain-containing protein n=1 Tax=Araneus ventricosus TaxID=182803 RepID=A0A4Y2JZP3_ARAVE|nr:hypothetical protein AVEN_274916-1 [Araneus ventricosus]